jgi:hypothetical protein
VPLTRRAWFWTALLIPAIAGFCAVIVWRVPSLENVGEAFTAVRWQWVVAAIALNLLSVIVRAVAWDTVIRQAMPPPHPRFRDVFSAFSVGLFGNAVLPGRIGELARVAVVRRKLPPYNGLWATLLGTVFAHRVIELVPVLLLVGYVLATAKIPEWAITSLTIAAVVGFALFTFALVSARRHEHGSPIDLAPARRLWTMARQGLGVMHAPLPAAGAVLLQSAAWLLQLFAVYVAMRAFQIDAPLPAAGLVLLLMNVATLFPLWPGNIGLVQAAVALPLLQYGVDSAHGIAYGFGLQAIEASVGIGLGLIFLGREGVSYAMLKVMPGSEQNGAPARKRRAEDETARARARVPG